MSIMFVFFYDKEPGMITCIKDIRKTLNLTMHAGPIHEHVRTTVTNDDTPLKSN